MDISISMHTATYQKSAKWLVKMFWTAKYRQRFLSNFCRVLVRNSENHGYCVRCTWFTNMIFHGLWSQNYVQVVALLIILTHKWQICVWQTKHSMECIILSFMSFQKRTAKSYWFLAAWITDEMNAKNKIQRRAYMCHCENSGRQCLRLTKALRIFRGIGGFHTTTVTISIRKENSSFKQ